MHGDGGQWIKNGLENFSNVKRLMDGFHLEKRLKEAAGRFPNRNLRRRIKEAIEEDDRKKLDREDHTESLRSERRWEG